ncbi:prepilin-type N-terminal cleavage/methylation domain-containing protein [Vibrio nitrifigilis]|uniref:Prepilin-type N-terminal cleavage/methylation domain-containing protein n=1 Tax=Vibrio nitrifigilis TaxID=2789781 RepID=A0ABS0G9L4_9VIBR|nr:prepilin-type N-terminal cleavage/methylation domain-containing protein [Vibrio nitrifigilis]MBF8998988.1 prepilin-type N-terminal cleavage/methylation domain-containing protein [Vibrio nitrifigilis]
MVILVAKSQGFSLLEILVALALSSLALTSLSAYFLQTHHSLLTLQQPLVLQQHVEQSLHSLTIDLHRAGYNSQEGKAATFTDVTHVVAVSNDHRSFGVVYFQPDEVTTAAYFHVVYRYDPENQNLLVCERESAILLSFSEVVQSTRTAPCYQIFDGSYIKLKDFVVDSQAISQGMEIRQSITVNYRASLTSHPDIAFSNHWSQWVTNGYFVTPEGVRSW